MPNINKNIIMQAGAAVANAANKAAGLAAATPEPGSIISVIQLVNGGRTIGPDALAHFTESVRNKLLSLLVSMEPIQDFNGYGHPWPAGGGANIWDEQWVADGSSRIKFKNRVKVTPGESYYWNGAGSTFYLFEDATGPNVGYQNIAQNSVFTAPSNVNYVLMYTSDSYGNVYKNDFSLNYPSTVTGYHPYSNICPISGRTGLHVYAGPTSAIGDAATYSMGWTSPAGTVYAGSADIVTGDIKAAPYYASYNGETLVGPWVSSMDEYDPQGTPTTGAQVVDLGGTMTKYHITGQDIITLVGDNYIWSDSGDVTIKE